VTQFLQKMKMYQHSNKKMDFSVKVSVYILEVT